MQIYARSQEICCGIVGIFFFKHLSSVICYLHYLSNVFSLCNADLMNLLSLLSMLYDIAQYYENALTLTGCEIFVIVKTFRHQYCSRAHKIPRNATKLHPMLEFFFLLVCNLTVDFHEYQIINFCQIGFESTNHLNCMNRQCDKSVSIALCTSYCTSELNYQLNICRHQRKKQ